MDQLLSAFVTVAECRSFTRAADILNTTQPAVSQSIQNLERRMNTKLLERSNKYVGLNKAGELVYHYAKEILHLYEQMDRLVSDMISEAGGALTIGSSLTFGEYILPHALARFLTQYPEVNPNISIANTRDVVEQVGSGRLDIGIIEGTYSNEDVIVENFAEDTVVIVAANDHPLAKSTHVTAEALSKETWIVRELGSGTREVTEAVLEKFHVHPASLLEFGSSQLIKESVEAGLGLTVLSKWVVRRELALNWLAEIKVSDEPQHRQFSIVTRNSDFRTKSTTLFATFLKEEATRFMTIQE